MKERLKLCYEFMQGSLHYYIFALICMASAIAIEMLTPLFLSFIVDSVLSGEASQLPGWLQHFMFSFGDRAWYLNNLWVLGVMLVAINLFGGLFLYLRGYLTARASENIAKTMRDRLYNHLQRWPYRSHVMAETGDLIQRCSSDVETTRRFLSGQMIEITRAVFIVILSLSVLIPIHAPLTLAAVILLPLIIWFSAFFFKKVTTAFREVDEAEGLLTAMMQENLTGVRVVRAFGRQRYEMDRFEKQNQSFRDLVVNMLKINGSFWASSDVICGLQIILAVGAAAYVAAQGELTAGAFLIFAMYSRRLVWPIRQLGRIISDMGRTFVAIDRIGEVLHSDVEDYDEEKSTPPIDGDIVFDDVCFGYEEDQVVLDHVSFTVPAGKTVAILGATGSGKSSMMLLMQRLYDVDSGKITIGGIDIRDINKKHLRERVGIVLQEPFLYSRSIQDNIGIAKPNSDPELIYRVASTAHAHNFINRFEKGYDTIVGERGVTLSGGQKQRVAIARTLLKDNDILIFDDSLSAVDTETDAAIRHELKTLRKDVTTFIISHRLTTLQEADYILVFEKGKVTQSGTHEELINQEGLYQRIYRIQSSLEDEVEEEMRA